MQAKRVMVFGTFDGIHEGHRYFFREAKKFGDRLIVVVARDASAQMLKNQLPKMNLAARIQKVREEKIADEVVAGDEIVSAWDIVKTCRPDVIALGYDQQELKENLEAHLQNFDWKPEIKIIGAHEPERYH